MNEPRRWLDDPRHVTWLVRALYGACAVLLLADLFIHRHAHFRFEEAPGFYAAVGFFAYCGIVMTARGLRRWLHRDEDYYGEAGADKGDQDA